jgi:hypothetical protein
VQHLGRSRGSLRTLSSALVIRSRSKNGTDFLQSSYSGKLLIN